MQHKKATKRYKDPVYGYIDLEPNLFEQFIDTAEFQRLRFIRQTGYMPVYSSATHNRFIHSIGVYYLGKLAFDALQRNSLQSEISCLDAFDWKKHREVFLKACLLHDVGHAPFSHTGEDFYSEAESGINCQLNDLVGSDSFKEDASRIKAAAPHETMSAIVGLSIYGDHFNEPADKEFFARCITGYKYSAEGMECEIKNAIISLLNSKTIDVDKLDYLVRDAFVTGFKTTIIDYERLLSGVTLCCVSHKNNEVEYGESLALAYRSGSISVLENVVLARDSEKRWIQNHPVILYEDMLLKRILRLVSKKFFGDVENLFCWKALTNYGNLIQNRTIRLLCDDDIICYAKQLDDERSVELFLNRGLRHKPFWKSEEEFNALVGSRLTDDERKSLAERYKNLEKHLIEITGLPFINTEAIERFKERIEEMKTELSDKDNNSSALRGNIKKYEESLSLAEGLFKLMGAAKEPEVAVITTDDFNSGFTSKKFGDTLISVPNKTKPIAFRNVSRIFDVEKSDEAFFYIYHTNGMELSAAECGKWILRDAKIQLLDD